MENLETNDTSLTLTILSALNKILKVNSATHSILVDEADGISMLENLQSHESEEVSEPLLQR